MRGRALKRYIVLLEDGVSTFIGTVHQITALVKQRPGTGGVTPNLIHDRVHYLSRDGRGGIIPMVKLTCRKNSCIEKATKSAAARAQKFARVEGFDSPVTAREVWQALVVNAGNTIPTKHTIYTRLVRGYRSKETLLMGKKEVGVKMHPFTSIGESPNALSKLVQDNRPRPLVPDIVRPRLWGQGGKPYYRPDSLNPWPELKRALVGDDV